MLAEQQLDIWDVLDELEVPEWFTSWTFLQQHEQSPIPEILFALMVLWGRNNGPWLLESWWDCGFLTSADLRDVVADIWTAAEYPERGMPRHKWRAIFRAAEYPVPSAPLTVYRGATAQGRLGMSWTTDRSQAQWFAERYARFAGSAPTHLYSATADPSAVLCMVDESCHDGGRDEHEVVVVPSRLVGIKRETAAR